MGGKVGAPANKALSQWMDEDGLDNPLREINDWKKYDRSTVDPETRHRFEAAIEKFFLNHTKKEIAEEGLRRGIRAVVANTPADVLNHPQLAARDNWIEFSGGGPKLKYPKTFFHASESENFINRPAPGIGQHNMDIYADELGMSEQALEELKKEQII
jgi:crotonobetainyl-CoA:carnitine CoA-transferase CaiB-like acyl-CoA transferase